VFSSFIASGVGAVSRGVITNVQKMAGCEQKKRKERRENNTTTKTSYKAPSTHAHTLD
jgi:hypothetical protein